MSERSELIPCNNYYNIGARLWLIQFRVLGGNLIKEHLNSENYIVAL